MKSNKRTIEEMLDNASSLRADIRMSFDEKNRLRNNLLAEAQVAERASIFGLPTLFFSSRFISASIATVLIAVSVPTLTAANESLPGDLLYPIKTEIMEEVVSAFQFNETDKAAYRVSLVERRLEETISIIESEDTEHVEAATKELSEDSGKALASVNQILAEDILIEDIEVSSKLDVTLDVYTSILNESGLQGAAVKEIVERDREINKKVSRSAIESFVSLSESQSTETVSEIISDIDLLSDSVNTAQKLKVLTSGLEETQEALAEENYAEAIETALETKHEIILLNSLDEELMKESS